MRTLTATALLLPATLAHAHDGHGVGSGPHWHASDLFGIALVVAIAAGLWFLRRK